MIPATYARVWCIDFEFSHQPGGLPLPLCMVAREVRTQELVRVWLADGVQSCPILFNKSDLIVAYYASGKLVVFSNWVGRFLRCWIFMRSFVG